MKIPRRIMSHLRQVEKIRLHVIAMSSYNNAISREWASQLWPDITDTKRVETDALN